jgi:hypothetical protein
VTTFLAIALFFLQAAAPAQGTLTLQGKVTDSSGALIPGVLVTVKHAGNKLPRLAVTKEDGTYVLTGLLPREYELLAYIPGFARVPRTVDLSASTDIDLQLTVSSLSSFPGISASRDPELPLPDPQTVKARQDAENAAAQLWNLTLRIEHLERSTDQRDSRSYRAIREFYFFGSDAVPALVLALQDEDVQVRRNAAVILAYFAAPAAEQPSVDILEALPTLRERLQDTDAEVRQVARRVIEAVERGR